MTNRILFCLAICLFGITGWAQQQTSDLRTQYDKQYGLDLTIYQGRAYQPEVNVESGFPFWTQEPFFTGSLVVDGQKYDSLLLKIDIYNHQLILGFHDLNGALKQVIVDPLLPDSVLVNGTVFIPTLHLKMPGRLVELIYMGKISCCVFWEKQKQLNTNSNSKGYYFSKQKNRRYFVYQGNLFTFSSLSQFCLFFDKHQSEKIKQFAKINGIKFRKCNSFQLKQLIEFVDQQILTQ